MLSKEECLLKYNALKNLSDYPILCGTENDENLESTPFNELFKEELDCFKQLINEHFDNPPLKVEDIKPNMMVWDNKFKEYFYVSPSFKKPTDWVRTYYTQSGWTDVSGNEYTQHHFNAVYFEENRFYKREVR